MRAALVTLIQLCGLAVCSAVEPTAAVERDKRDAVAGAQSQSGAVEPSGEPARIWVDSSGRYQVEASLIKRDRESVTLRRQDGITVHVPVNRLSDRDQRYLQRASNLNSGEFSYPRSGLNSGEFSYRAVAAFGERIQGVAQAASTLVGYFKPADGAAARTNNSAVATEPPLQLLAQLFDAADLPADIVHIDVSERTLKKLVDRPIARNTAVNETIVGTPVRGTATTRGTVNLQLIPAAQTAVVELVFQGQVDSQTTGFGGPVQIHSTGVTAFSAAKRVLIDERGIAVLPTRVAARSSVAIQKVSTDLPRLRGRIARRIGSRRAAESRPAAEAEAAQKAAAQIAWQFDRDVSRELNTALAALPIDRGTIRGRLQFATSDDYLHLAVHGRGTIASSAPPPAPATLGSPEIAVHVHRAAVERVARNTQLRQFIVPLITAMLSDEKPSYVSLVADSPSVAFKPSADGQWWSLVVPKIDPRKR